MTHNLSITKAGKCIAHCCFANNFHCVKKFLCINMRLEQAINFSAQFRIIAASLIQKCGTLRRLLIGSYIEQFFYLLPLIEFHLCISLNNHDLATAQSRFTVAVEISRSCAISSSLKSAKNRSSTILACLGSIFESFDNASSSSSSDAQFFSTTIIASSNETFCSPAPLFWAC